MSPSTSFCSFPGKRYIIWTKNKNFSWLTDFSLVHCCCQYVLTDLFTFWGRDQSPGLLARQLCLPWWAVYTINLNKIIIYSAQCYVCIPVKEDHLKQGLAYDQRHLRPLSTATGSPSARNFSRCHIHTCIWAPGPGPPIKIQSCSLVSDWLGKKYGNW